MGDSGRGGLWTFSHRPVGFLASGAGFTASYSLAALASGSMYVQCFAGHVPFFPISCFLELSGSNVGLFADDTDTAF